MVMSTQTWANASALLSGSLLSDTVQVYSVGQPVTNGALVSRSLTALGDPVPALVQSTVLENAIESLTEQVFSVKVARGTSLLSGQAVKVLTCVQEPTLVGKILFIDKVSMNGLALIRKAVARDYELVNSEGKGQLA